MMVNRLGLSALSLALAACGSSSTSATTGAPSASASGSASSSPSASPSASGSSGAASSAAPSDKGDLRQKVAAFVPATLTADVASLPPEEKRAMDKIIAAARLLDPVYDRQVWAKNPETRAALAKDTSDHGKDVLAYFDIMRGPWDRQDDWKPFATDEPHPKGAGFYPKELTADALKSYVAAHKDQKDALESLTTVVKIAGDKLTTEPYSKVYAEWLKPSAALLEEAAKETKNKSLAKFLKARAAAFLSDQYRQSDKDWMDLDSRVEATIGPYETYEDALLGQKASFEAYVTVSDPAESAKLDKYKKLLPAMELNLPIPPGAHGKRGGDSPIHVVDIVYSSGEARGSVQTIAFNLPNDEVVRKEKGAKKVLLRNLIVTKFDRIMRPLAAKILAPAQMALLSGDAFFDETLFHELSHSLGPAFVKGTKDKEVRTALESSFSAIEECKADVMGAYNVLYLIQRGDLPKTLHDQLLVSYFAGLFRSVRFGVSEAHGKAAAVQINRYLEEGGAELDTKANKLNVNLVKLEASISKLAHDLAVIEWEGDKAAADDLLKKYGAMPDALKGLMKDMGDIPVDIKPVYPLAGESEEGKKP
jgi:Peptidase family M49